MVQPSPRGLGRAWGVGVGREDCYVDAIACRVVGPIGNRRLEIKIKISYREKQGWGTRAGPKNGGTTDGKAAGFFASQWTPY